MANPAEGNLPLASIPLHTPGPWLWQPSTRTIRSVPTNYWLATLDSWDGAVKPHNDANGHLMAAAPALAEALRRLDGAVSEILSSRAEGDAPTAGDWEEAYLASEAARAALRAAGVL